MIKRLLILLVALVPLTALAGVADRDILLTDDGTLYTVESVYANDVAGLQAASERVLTLTVQQGSNTSTSVVPATTGGGWHVYPSLAYDSQSKTLFVFWEAARNNFTSSDLYVCAYQNGTWDKASSLDSAQWAVRQNFHIAITRTSEQDAADGTVSQVPEINVHAVWWEDNGAAEWARYAMITVDKGAVTSIYLQDLSAFVNAPAPGAQPTAPASLELLRHPAVVETRTHDSVDVLFGDMNSMTIRRTNIHSTIQGGRLRVPVGRSGSDIPAPGANVLSTGAVDTIVNGDNIAYYFDGQTPNTMDYLIYTAGAWSPVHEIALTEKLSHDSAVAALQKLIIAQ